MSRQKKFRRFMLFLGCMLALSLIANGCQLINGMLERHSWIFQSGANSRPTYFTVHNIAPAHTIATGKGVKVGVLDSSFGLSDYPELYAGGADFAGDKRSLERTRGHGYAMAAVLREIAPDCEIYALNIDTGGEKSRVDSIDLAVDWAVENSLDVLTLSQAQVSEKNRARMDEAVEKAVENGMVTTFIHYDHPANLLPYSTTPYYEGEYGREPDINVYHYDYGTVDPGQLRDYDRRTQPAESGNDVPYFSYSSMSPVTAGFVAVLKSADGSLTVEDCRRILVDTSYSLRFEGEMAWETGVSPHTVDLYQAVLSLG